MVKLTTRFQRAAMRALDQETDFQSIISEDAIVSEHIDKVALSDLFDHGYFIEQVDQIFDRLGIEGSK